MPAAGLGEACAGWATVARSVRIWQGEGRMGTRLDLRALCRRHEGAAWAWAWGEKEGKGGRRPSREGRRRS